jgi:MoaA/NifB/PqqE/SkfB family radical SAM enzyme
MIKTIAIKLKNPEPMTVTWDLGRRCNYDCSYCEATRHNNFSRHRSLDELKQTLKFIKEYAELYGYEHVNINFTGGEPTTNPIFFEFAEYAKLQNFFKLGLTTNGAFSPKFLDNIENNFDWVTVSYHAESNAKLKDTVINNIKSLSLRNIRLQTNIMMHVDYWDECVKVCDQMKAANIKYNPRPIGDGNITRSGWFKDIDGTDRRTSHQYNQEQQDWYFKQMGLSPSSKESKEGTELGRNCCGGRCVLAKVDRDYEEVNLIDTHFKGWYCSVNRYFLHIDNETELVYHHQTCQAMFNGKRGSIGSLSDTQKILEYVKENKNNIIVCPNQRCGCGMCVPKSKDLSEFILNTTA